MRDYPVPASMQNRDVINVVHARTSSNFYVTTVPRKSGNAQLNEVRRFLWNGVAWTNIGSVGLEDYRSAPPTSWKKIEAVCWNDTLAWISKQGASAFTICQSGGPSVHCSAPIVDTADEVECAHGKYLMVSNSATSQTWIFLLDSVSPELSLDAGTDSRIIAVTESGVLFDRSTGMVFWEPWIGSPQAPRQLPYATILTPSRLRANWHNSIYFAVAINGTLQIGSSLCFSFYFIYFINFYFYFLPFIFFSCCRKPAHLRID
jgi:hypothetical protein